MPEEFKARLGHAGSGSTWLGRHAPRLYNFSGVVPVSPAQELYERDSAFL